MKYKILGFSLTAFVIFWLFLLLKPDKGLDPTLSEGANIDSISISKGPKHFTITSRKEINDIAAILAKPYRLNSLDRMNINTDFYDLTFYSKRAGKPITVRILHNQFNGIVLSANDSYYKGDGVDKWVQSSKSN